MKEMEQAFLNNPSAIELDDAYRGMSKLGAIQVKTSTLDKTISDMEKIGFVAMKILAFAENRHSFTLQASKGKHGPCHYSGRSAEYTGRALAALDDDNHLFIQGRQKSVCDKTSEILKLKVFDGLIEHKEKESSPKISEEDFEESQEALYRELKDIAPTSDRKNLFYPGPFHLLILHDGTVVRRGSWTGIPAKMAKELIRYDGLKDWDGPTEDQLSIFQDLYSKEGSICLMHELKLEAFPNQRHETDFNKLKSISRGLKERLINLIEEERKYFVLIGNEADDKLGCCPSEEVSEANALVRSGILDALSEPVQGDQCPVTLYAFKNELSKTETGFASNIDTEFRNEVLKQIHRSGAPLWQSILKWILLVFVAISLIFATQKLLQVSNNSSQNDLTEILSITQQTQLQVVLFHHKKRCYHI